MNVDTLGNLSQAPIPIPVSLKSISVPPGLLNFGGVANAESVVAMVWVHGTMQTVHRLQDGSDRLHFRCVSLPRSLNVTASR